MFRSAVAVLISITACIDADQRQEVIIVIDTGPPAADTAASSTSGVGSSDSGGSEGGDGSGGSTDETSTGASDDDAGSGAPAFDVAAGADDGASWCPTAPHHQDMAINWVSGAAWVARPGEAVLVLAGGFGEPDVMELRYRLGPGSPEPRGVSVSKDGRAVVAHSQGLTLVHTVVPDPTTIVEGWYPWGACSEAHAGSTAEPAAPSEAVALSWGTDACVGWTSPVVAESIAWARGEWSKETCSYDAVVYAGAADGVHVLDGETGAQVAHVATPGVLADIATGRDGEAWGLVRGQSLVRIDPVTYDVDVFPLPVGTGWGVAFVPNFSDGDTVVVCDGSGVSILELDTMTWAPLWSWQDEPVPGATDDAAGRRGCAPLYSNGVSFPGYLTTNDVGAPIIRLLARGDNGWGSWSNVQLVGTDQSGGAWRELASGGSAGVGSPIVVHSDNALAATEAWGLGGGGLTAWGPGGTIWGDPTGGELVWQ